MEITFHFYVPKKALNDFDMDYLCDLAEEIKHKRNQDTIGTK